MKNRGKKLAAILGAVALVICQNGVLEVRAEEPQASQESPLQEGTDGKTDDTAKETENLESNETPDSKNGETNTEQTQNQEVEAEGTEKTADDIQNSEDNTLQPLQMDAEAQQSDEESQQVADENKERITSLKSAENLGWKSGEGVQKGTASFIIPNEKGTASYKVDLWRNGEWYKTYNKGAYGDLEKGSEVKLYLFHTIQDGGTYKIQVTTLDMDGEPVNQAFSSDLSFVLSDEELPVPTNISWDKDGIFSCDRPDNAYFRQYTFVVFDQNGEQVGVGFGSPYKGLSEFITRNDEEGITFDVNGYLEKEYGRTPEKGFCIFVQAGSADTSVYKNSPWSDKVMFGNEPYQAPDNEGDHSSSDKESKDEDSRDEESPAEEVVYEEWKPTTPDEIKRYAVYSREKVEYTTNKENAYSLTINNAMQGKQCFDSFEAVLGDWTMGRTYNILPAGKAVNKMDSKASIALNIPKALQKEGREFQMICVTEKGRPILLKDLDTNPETITFETDTYYAFALIYKDTVAK